MCVGGHCFALIAVRSLEYVAVRGKKRHTSKLTISQPVLEETERGRTREIGRERKRKIYIERETGRKRERGRETQREIKREIERRRAAVFFCCLTHPPPGHKRFPLYE